MSPTTPLFKAEVKTESISPLRQSPGMRLPPTRTTTARSINDSRNGTTSPLKRALASSISPVKPALQNYESPSAKLFKEQKEKAKAGGIGAGPPASAPDRVGIPVRTVETQTDIQLGTEVWILHQGSTGNGSANSDRDIHAWDIVESSDEDGSDEDDNESCSDDGYNEFEDIDEPISRVTDKSEDDNVLELDVI